MNLNIIGIEIENDHYANTFDPEKDTLTRLRLK